MHAHSVVILNQRRWQSLGGQHGKGVNELFEKVSSQAVFEGSGAVACTDKQVDWW